AAQEGPARLPGRPAGRAERPARPGPSAWDGVCAGTGRETISWPVTTRAIRYAGGPPPAVRCAPALARVGRSPAPRRHRARAGQQRPGSGTASPRPGTPSSPTGARPPRRSPGPRAYRSRTRARVRRPRDDDRPRSSGSLLGGRTTRQAEGRQERRQPAAGVKHPRLHRVHGSVGDLGDLLIRPALVERELHDRALL